MRDRRLLARRSAVDGNPVSSVEMPAPTDDEKKERYKHIMREHRRKGIIHYFFFIAVTLGIPLMLVYYFTPFFVFQHLRCRAGDKFLRSDRTVETIENEYTSYFRDPPLYPSDAYNLSMFWGTYEPSRIFAMKSRSAQPVIVGIAWYDTPGTYSLRHVMPFTHNKVRAPRTTYKVGADPEVMKIRWIAHDGIHYGKQIVVDAANKLQMEVEFLKSPSGNAWHVRVHAHVESPIEFVLYLANADVSEAVRIEAPSVHNDGDWSPVLKSKLLNHRLEKESFKLRVYDDHSPFYDTAPWRIYGLQADLDDSFALTTTYTVGGTPDERAMTAGRGIAFGHQARKLQEQRIDLRNLPSAAFTYIETVDPQSFRSPGNHLEADQATHNMVVLKKFYNSDFRLELSLSPAPSESAPETHGAAAEGEAAQSSRPQSPPTYERLSTCQLSNIFRRREKAIARHMRNVCRYWVNGFRVKGDLYQHILAQTLGETFGSISFTAGRYLELDERVDEAQDQLGVAQTLWSEQQLKPSHHPASAMAVVGSRTDEAFGQHALTGLPLLFLLRWNKEVAKDVLASWLIGAQNPRTGFLPNRAGFTAVARSLMPTELRYEHLTFGSPPTLLLGLQELLNEMARKAARLRRANPRKRRNTEAYFSEEVEADRRFLQALLPALQRWRGWWHRTQCGGATRELAEGCASRRPLEEWPRGVTGDPADLLLYRWRSRDGFTLPASGMGDYPRPFCSGAHILEAHVDLFAWVALLSELISRIEVRHLGLPASVTVDWEAHLAAAHWDAARGRYADRTGCGDHDFSPYVGYVNLFPVLLGVVRQNREKIRATFQLAREALQTKFGLMSVSFDSVRRSREAGLPHRNVWMGYVWPSVNLMFLYALKSTYLDILAGNDFGKEMQNFYSELRLNMAETIRNGNRWWEFYNPVDGRGEGSKTYIGTQALLLGILNDFSSK
ncbi:unnamed protein product [Phytomonas sp. EM1]|nr:unnamed protein product [Phytomonas sp. EM1]|eukprot:CCW62278.1 unnamed protein product [Phytomonas sp. isolate EM1]